MQLKAAISVAVIVIMLAGISIYGNSDTYLSNKNPSTILYTYIPNYNSSKAIEYALMVHNEYFHKAYYPSGLNYSVMQKNLDYFNSEDCAHFVSEALIAGGLTYLAQNPPGDNLTNYGSGFPGSYGIVGVYRLADWLAGYVLPIISTNSTIEGLIGYQPIPASYIGSPHAAVYYVTNDSILPSYIIWPGDVVMDVGVGDGHAMLYIGNNDVVQTDPADLWSYIPGYDDNISTTLYISSSNGTLTPINVLTLNGENVSSIYLSIPTFPFNSKKEVRITILQDGVNVTGSRINFNKEITFVGSFPRGIGFGNYSYEWKINGKVVSKNQVFTTFLKNSSYTVTLSVTGSNGTVYSNYTIGSPSSLKNSWPNIFVYIGGAIIIAVVSIIYYKRKKRE